MVKMIMHSSIINHVLTFLSLVLVFSVTESKKVGKEIFSCSPKSFTFRLDFDGQCPGNIASRQGIEGTDCFFIRDPKHTSPLVAVKSIQIIEVNLDLSNLSVKNLNGDFEDGYSWKYDSLTAGELSDKREVPGGIQLNIRGLDSDGNVITNSVIIDYSNEENAHQFLKVGDKIGWIVIKDLAPARKDYCPFVSEDSSPSYPASSAPATMAPIITQPISKNPGNSPIAPKPSTSLDSGGKGRGKKASGLKQKKSRSRSMKEKPNKSKSIS